MKTSIIIPMYNEEGNAAIILDELLNKTGSWSGDYEIIAVDDNSTDNTPAILKEYASRSDMVSVVTKRGREKGMGAALMEGGRKARGEILVWVMGDLSDDLGKIPEMVEAIKSGADIVFASRYMPGGSSGDLDKLKAFLSSRFTFFARFFFGLKVHDITNAYRAFRKKLTDEIHLESTDFAISPELAIKAHLLGYRLSEIPCSYKTRVSGKTKFKIFKMVLKYMTLFRYVFYRNERLVK